MSSSLKVYPGIPLIAVSSCCFANIREDLQTGGSKAMSLEVLVATMFQHDYSLPAKMNIQSDAIIGNQCDRNEVIEIDYNGHRIRYLSFAERGVGLNRNNALMRSTAELCVLADDDQVFVDGYSEVIEESFRRRPDADVLLFNVECPRRYVIMKPFRVRFFNFMRFGGPRIAFRRTSVTKRGICFNLHFGGGAKYGAGEDVLFLADCLRKGLRVFAVPETIARLTNERESTWFTGYDEKFFIDRGALFSCMSPRCAALLCLQFAIRHRSLFRSEFRWFEALRLMLEGSREFSQW